MKLRGNQSGFSLLEMLIVIGIVGTLGGVMSMTTVVMTKVSRQSNEQAAILSQVQNAGYWISRDVNMAHTITIDEVEASPEFITLTLPVTADTDKTVVYELQDMEGGMKKLIRSDQYTGAQALIAEYIYYDPSGDPDDSTDVISYASPTLAFRITAVQGEEMASERYEAIQRAPTTE